MLKVLIISTILMGIAFLGLAFRILFVRQGRFPQISIGKNKQMRGMGITCVRHDELKCYKNGKSSSGCGCV
jgi:hypothetical protein